MGLGSSREWFGQRSSRQSYRYGKLHQQRHNSHRRRITTTTTVPIIPFSTRPLSYQSPYNNYYAGGPFSPYTGIPPIASPYPSIGYTGYPASSQAPPQYMMMMPSIPRLPPNVPSPYGVPFPVPTPAAAAPVGSPMSTPYFQQPVARPVSSNISVPAPAPAPAPAYPPAAPSALITDWTGGGKISPGFLGPPI